MHNQFKIVHCSVFKKEASISRFFFALLFSSLILASALVYFIYFSQEKPTVKVYSAPTLAKLASDLAKKAQVKIDLRQMGSIAAFNLIRSGNIPDLYFSVELELASKINARRIIELGSYELLLLCKGNYTLKDIAKVKIAIANPNTAPIGYRSLTVLYFLSEKGYLNKTELERDLNVKYDMLQNGTLLIDATQISPIGRFYMRSNIEEAASLIEQGVAECTFAYWPFIIARGYGEGYNFVKLPSELRFISDPPLPVLCKLNIGLVKVKKEGAFVASFTQAGDYVLNFLSQLDLTSYGLIPSK